MFPRDERGGLARLFSESTALLEIGWTLALQRRLLRHAPEGDGHPVMLLPGFTATDRAMGRLRRFLCGCGYDAHGWGQGRNMGVSDEQLQAAAGQLSALYADTGRRVSLIGWSGGGMYARALARALPGMTRQVITLGTPFKLTEETLQYLPAGIYKLHERLNPPGETVEDVDSMAWFANPPVPSSSLYSERDALAPWPFCLDHTDHESENIHVPGSHAGMTWNPLMYYVIADRLAQPETEWQPFRVDGLRSVLFRKACASQYAWAGETLG